jgi:hypothetical protein
MWAKVLKRRRLKGKGKKLNGRGESHPENKRERQTILMVKLSGRTNRKTNLWTFNGRLNHNKQYRQMSSIEVFIVQCLI